MTTTPGTLIEGAAIDRFQLVVLRSAVKLEKLGMKRRGTSATAIAKARFGLKRNATHDDVIARIGAAIEEFDGAQA